MRCPCCRQDWPGPDRIAFLGRMIVTPLGHCALKARHAALVRKVHERRGGLPLAELEAYWPGRRDPPACATQWMRRTNRRLAPLGWRLLKITHRDGGESYGLVETLRNERGVLRASPAAPGAAASASVAGRQGRNRPILRRPSNKTC
ncbi:MAG: hypothetical protein OEM93_10460 [Rhodospirillales bacterium]|nr:hypothetical protein [Rhodospirillales bacterium]MDH3790933.1 hypothetical protein [Rhodospirillales bacterium]